MKICMDFLRLNHSDKLTPNFDIIFIGNAPTWSHLMKLCLRKEWILSP